MLAIAHFNVNQHMTIEAPGFHDYNFADVFGIRKLESRDIVQHCSHDPRFRRLGKSW